MQDRWKLGNYTFTINPNKYSEQITVVGDTIITLDGTVITQPTTNKEDYSLSAIFYQNRPRVISQVSMPNLGGMKYVNGKFYVLNNTTKKVDVYTSNMTLSKSIAIVATPNGENFTSFDVQTDETIWAVQTSVMDVLWKVSGGTTTKTNFNLGAKVTGVKYYNGYVWVVTDNRVLYQLTTSLSIVNSVSLPYIAPNDLGYNGMDAVNGYLVISYTNDDISGACHIDTTNGNLCNIFSLPNLTQIIDVTYDGANFIFSTYSGNQLIYTNGNTVMLDIYNLEKEIKTKGYIDMIDDMGVKRRLAVTRYSIDRQEGSIAKYNVEISATKVDRGVN
jgi:hypothetical protein